MKFNEKLISLRKEKGLSQETLGEKLNVARQTVSKWELGETTPEMDKLVKMSEIFEISLDSLIKDTSVETNTVNNTNNSKLTNIVIIILKIIGALIIASIVLAIIGVMLFSTVRKEARVEKNIKGDDDVVQEQPTRDANLSQMKKITSNQVKQIRKDMSCSDIKNLLGETLENGFGAYILNYIVDNKYILVISFSSMAQPANFIGEELLNNLTPIEEYMR